MDDIPEPAVRRERLVARCAAQREALAGSIRELERPIAVLDQAVRAARFMRAHPLAVAAVVAALVALRRRSILVLVARGVAAWRMWRALAALAEGLETRWLRRRAAGRS